MKNLKTKSLALLAPAVVLVGCNNTEETNYAELNALLKGKTDLAVFEVKMSERNLWDGTERTDLSIKQNPSNEGFEFQFTGENVGTTSTLASRLSITPNGKQLVRLAEGEADKGFVTIETYGEFEGKKAPKNVDILFERMEDAPEGTNIFKVEFEANGEPLTTEDLDTPTVE